MQRWLFNQVHKRHLIYNQCWEDPVIDREALKIVPGDRIVMITSAGCNALDYLLSDPDWIDCVDLNPHQTALLELKLAALKTLSYAEFFEMFGTGRIQDHQEVYRRRLRPLLSCGGRRTWDSRIRYFDPAGRGLYFHGSSGFVARAFAWYIDHRAPLRAEIDHMQTIRDVEEQAAFYHSRIAPQLWTPAVRWLLRRHVSMALLGVPEAQVKQIRSTARQDLSAFIRSRVDRVFTTIPIADNYFWRVYMNGRYSPECCPNYLKEENFERLRERCSRIRLHSMSLADFLAQNRGPFSVYVLLDHMDWLTNSKKLLYREWRRILETARPGARIIYRSGGASFDHVPAFARRRIEYRPDIAGALHERDRVGTYGSFHLAWVRA